MHGMINILSPQIQAERHGYLGLEFGPHDYGQLKLAYGTRRVVLSRSGGKHGRAN